MTGFGSARQSWAPPKQADSGGMAAKNEQSARSGGGTMPNGRGSGSSAETPAQSKSKPSTQNRHGDTAKPGRMKPVSVYMDVRSGEAYEVLTEYDSGEDPEDGEYKDGNRAGKRGSGAVAAAGPGKKGGTSKSTTTTTTSTNSTDNDAPGPGSKDRKRPRRQVAARAAKHLAAVPAGLAGPSASTCKTATSFTVPSRDLRSRSSSSDIIIASDPADLTASETRNGPPKRSTTSSRNKPTMNADGRGNAVAGESRRTVGKSRQAATINLLDSSDEEDAAAQASDIGNAPPSRATRIAKRSQRPPVPSSSDDAPKDVDEVEQPGDEEEEDMGELPTALAARMAKRAKKLREPIPSFSTPDVDSQKPKAGQSDKDGPGGNGRPEATVPAHILAGPSTSRQARALQTPLDLAATTAANRQPPGAPRRNQTDPVLLGKRKRIHVAKDGNDGNEDGHGDEGQKKEKAARGSASQPVPIDAAADVQPPAVTASAPVPAPAPAPEAKPVITPDPEENVEVQAEHEHVGAEPTPEDLAAIAALTAADKEVAGAASASTNTSASASASAPHDPTAAHLARILEILPDADMNYILAQIATYAPAVPAPAATVAGGEAAGGSTTPHQPPANKYAGTEQSTDPVERVLADAFEKGYEKAKKGEGSGSGSGNGSGSGSGPASGGKGKRKRQGEDYKSKEYRKGERAGRMYERRCREWLEAKFELVPLQFIRQTSKDNNLQLTPTYYVLAAAYALPHKDRPFNTLKSGRKGKSKAGQVDDDSFLARLLAEDGAQGGGKGNAKMEEGVGVVDGVWVGDGDEGEMEFVREREWLLELLDETDRTDREAAEKAAARDLALAEGHGIECGCCFTEEIMDDLVQCQEGHLFCKDCVKQLAEVAIGEQKHKITCMDQTSCQAPFLDSTLYSVLSEKSIALYERLKQQSELEAAGLEGLETCPDCSFAAIIDNPDEKLFRCLNETCGKVSCRGCWKEEHLPRSCAEVEAEKHLDKRHAIEDAMSKALIRECPKPGCKTKFVKSDGCNKMICTKCRTMSCYVCRVIIKGYEHFEQTPQDPNLPRTSKGCFLWDDMAKADQDAVLAARDAARAEQEAALAADGQAVPAKMLEVDAPPAPPPARLPGRPLVANPAVAAQMADLHARAQAAHHHLRVQALQPAVPAGMLGFGAANPVLPVYHRAARRDMARNIDEMMHAVAGAGLPLGAVRPGMHANADVPIAGGLYGDDDGNDRAGHMGAGFRFGDPIGFGLQAAAAAQAGIGRAFGFGAGHGVGRAQQPGAYPGPPLGEPENGLMGREGDAAARVRLQADRERRNDMAGQVLGAVRR